MNAMFSTKLTQRISRTLLIAVIISFQANAGRAVGTYLDFEEFSVANGPVPADAKNWLYSSSVTNNYGITESKSSGWRSKTTLSDGLHWFFELNRNNVCYDHLYGDTYGYLDITANGHTGKALKEVITGGRALTGVGGACPNPPSGVQLYNKESYTGLAQAHTAGKIGAAYLYFKRISAIGGQRVTTPYKVVAGSNRMSAYVYLPPETSNGVGGHGNPVHQTFQVGLFTNPAATGSHHYVNFLTRGGGWTKLQIEETTNGDNSGNGATRYIPNFLQSLWQFYFVTLPMSGIATPPYEILIDDIAFERDDYAPQNNETISNVALLYKDADKNFEISFNDKYKNSAEANAIYELRYSFNPITNENWSTATRANIIADTRFAILARTDGKFQKWSSYYQGVWAPFRLSAADTAKLSPGVTVYFAVKDVSQVDGNSRVPNDGINGVWGARKGGRTYDTNSAFDYTYDQAALLNIKRVSYLIGSGGKTLPARNLRGSGI